MIAKNSVFRTKIAKPPKPKVTRNHLQDAAAFLDYEGRLGWTYFLKAYKVVTETIDKKLRDNSSLSLAELELILYVIMSGGRIRFIDLAKLSLLSQSRISRQIDALRIKGFLLRESTDSDRRAAFAVLTPRGKEAFEEAMDIFRSSMDEHYLNLITRPKLSAFTEILSSLMQLPDYADESLAILEKARKSALES